MNKLAAFFIATTALTAATPGFADVYVNPASQDEPFFWTDAGTAPEEVPAASADQSPANPMMRDYPVEDSPQHHVPAAGKSAYFEDDCEMGSNSPRGGVGGAGLAGPERSGDMTPQMHRRGETTGDDGVLEAIQDDPCAKIWRRGGPTTASEEEYTDPSDIRRANTLEDRRIPVHDVGRYSAENSDIWYRDPGNPFVDAPRSWDIERGTMLSHLLTGWGEEAGFNVVWRSPHDYVVQTDVTIRGTFPEAAGQVLESFANANPPIAADFYLANRTLVVNSASEFDAR